MLRYVMQKLGYGHNLELIEKQAKPIKRTFVFISNVPNYDFLEKINSELLVDFNPHMPVSDFLPFTPTEYLLGAIHWLTLNKPITAVFSSVSKTTKFTAKTLIDIPPYPMGALEFINVLQNSIKFINSYDTFKGYFILPHTDVVLNAATSNTFTKTAMSLSIPLDVTNALNTIKFCCDIETEHYTGPFFSYTFNKVDDRWSLRSITATKFWHMGTPFEIFMYAWAMMLRDIDHICNRVPYKVIGEIIDVNHHYNLRSRYDISEGLLNVAKIIDSELRETDGDYIPIQTILKDNNLVLSSFISDFKAAILILQQQGSERKIVL